MDPGYPMAMATGAAGRSEWTLASASMTESALASTSTSSVPTTSERYLTVRLLVTASDASDACMDKYILYVRDTRTASQHRPISGRADERLASPLARGAWRPLARPGWSVADLVGRGVVSSIVKLL